jgi:hypothetical protein
VPDHPPGNKGTSSSRNVGRTRPCLNDLLSGQKEVSHRSGRKCKGSARGEGTRVGVRICRCALTSLLSHSRLTFISFSLHSSSHAHLTLISLSSHSHLALISLASHYHLILVSLSSPSYLILISLSSHPHLTLISLSSHSCRILITLASRCRLTFVTLSFHSHPTLISLPSHLHLTRISSWLAPFFSGGWCG